MEVFYPPVGIAHITNDLSDLFIDRLRTAKTIQVACITQPKSSPHFGTMVVLFCAFALAKKLKNSFGLEATVLLDMLENSPAEEIIINDVIYSFCLSHRYEKNKSLATINQEKLHDIANWASSTSKIKYISRNYNQIQAQKAFRKGLLQILIEPEKYLPMLSPSEKKLRIRPICPSCGIVDKKATTVTFDLSLDHNNISFICPNHGEIKINLDENEGTIDCNASIRTILRTLGFISDKENIGKETIIINGSDWAGAWMQRVYFDSLAMLGVSGIKIPFNLFTPEISDWSGAKLSKTIYLKKGAYSDLDEAWISTPAFQARYGENGMMKLWNEIELWVNDPKKFFRNYSIEYIQSLFK